MSDQQRFKFIGNALQGDGPFRPTIAYDVEGNAVNYGDTYLNKYPRESTDKFARRIEVAFYASPLARVTSKFTGYIGSKKVQRDINSDMLKLVAEDTDGKGNQINVFWQHFMVNAKARGSMLLLVDMPSTISDNRQSQLDERLVPFWTAIEPEQLTDYEVGDDGKFNFAKFAGTYQDSEGENQDCIWYFDRKMWECIDKDDKIIDSNQHNLGECPLLIFAETGEYPSFGPFAPIADVSKRLYNLDSELDEILRSQTFSLLTFQVSEESTSDDRINAAQQAGETIGTSNMLMHTGNTPSFVAPPDGPAKIYMDRIAELNRLINEIGLDVTEPNQRESGIAKQIRFQSINAELAKFSVLMEGIERRAWGLTSKWLSLSEEPEIIWPRDFNIADTEQELDILGEMQSTAMPPEVINAQQKKVVATQFSGLDMEDEEDLKNSIDAGLSDG